jgi:hypothetical protein
MSSGNRLHHIALGIVLILASPAWGLSPSHVYEGQGHEKEPDQTRQGQTADQPPEEPIGIVPSDTPPPADLASQDHDRDHQAEKDAQPDEPSDARGFIFFWGDTYAQWVMAASGIAAIGISAWAVWLLWRTLRTTREAVEEGRRATKAAERAVEVTAKTAERQLRAYVTLYSGAIRWENNQTFSYHIAIKNTGQTPALNLTHQSNCGYGPVENFRTDEIARRAITLGAGNTTTLRQSADHSLGDANWTGIRNGTIPLYVWGRIEYRDIFWQGRHLQYRMELLTGPGINIDEGLLTPCYEGNESSDDNP